MYHLCNYKPINVSAPHSEEEDKAIQQVSLPDKTPSLLLTNEFFYPIEGQNYNYRELPPDESDWCPCRGVCPALWVNVGHIKVQVRSNEVLDHVPSHVQPLSGPFMMNVSDFVIVKWTGGLSDCTSMICLKWFLLLIISGYKLIFTVSVCQHF